MVEALYWEENISSMRLQKNPLSQNGGQAGRRRSSQLSKQECLNVSLDEGEALSLLKGG